MMLYGKAIDVDVICQHTKDGVIIPMRCRLADEEGVINEYNIISSNQLEPDNDGYVSGGLFVGPYSIAYDCKIKAYDRIRFIRLMYNYNKKNWEVRC